MKYKVLWIDPAVRDYQVFVDSVNEDTLALVYPEPLVFDLENKVERIGFVFELHGPMATYLLENAELLIQSGVKHMDFLACDTLPSWQPYYDTLTGDKLTGIKVGASNNRTGNLQYGGDWLMESTCEDVEAIYFTDSIQYYKYLLGIGNHTLILDFSGNLWGCGSNIYGQLAKNTYTSIPNFSFMRSGVPSFAAGADHTLALDFSGNLWGCGRNYYGQLAKDPATDKIPNFSFMRSGVKSFATGGYHTLALDFSGNLWGCGYNYYGQLAKDPATSTSVIPNFSFMRSGVASFAAGAVHTLALDFSGNLWGCGYNYYGQLAKDPATDKIPNFSFMRSGVRSIGPIENTISVALIEKNAAIINSLVNIYGSQFSIDNTSYLMIGNTSVGISVINPLTIQFRVPNAPQTNATVDLYTNIGALRAPNAFTILPFFNLTGYNPSSVILGTQVQLFGSNFSDISYVQFGDKTMRPFSVSSTQINVSVPANLPDQVTVTVFDLYNNSSSMTTNLTILNLSIGSITPPISARNTSITLTGDNLGNASYVVFGNTSTRVSFKSASQVNVSVPILIASLNFITLYDIYGNNTSSVFTLDAFPVTSFNPSKVSPGAPLQIMGNHFYNISYVQFGTINLSRFTVSSTQINLSVPRGLPDNVSVTVVDIYNTSTTLDISVLNLSFLSITSRGVRGAPVTLLGSNLENVSYVKFGTVNQRPFSKNSSTVNVSLPFGVIGNVSVGIYDLYGNNVSSYNASTLFEGINLSYAIQIQDTVTLIGSGLMDLDIGLPSTFLSDTAPMYSGYVNGSANVSLGSTNVSFPMYPVTVTQSTLGYNSDVVTVRGMPTGKMPDRYRVLPVNLESIRISISRVLGSGPSLRSGIISSVQIDTNGNLTLIPGPIYNNLHQKFIILTNRFKNDSNITNSDFIVYGVPNPNLNNILNLNTWSGILYGRNRYTLLVTGGGTSIMSASYHYLTFDYTYLAIPTVTHSTCYFGYFKPPSPTIQFTLNANDVASLRIGTSIASIRSNGPVLLDLSTLNSVTSNVLNLDTTAYYPIVWTYVNTSTNVASLEANVIFEGTPNDILSYCTTDKITPGLFAYNLSQANLSNLMSDIPWPSGSDFTNYNLSVLDNLSRIYSSDWAYGTLNEQTYWTDSSMIPLIEAPIPLTRLNISNIQVIYSNIVIQGTGFHANCSVYLDGTIRSRTFNGDLNVSGTAYSVIYVRDGLAYSNYFSGVGVNPFTQTTGIRNSSVNVFGYNFSTATISSITIGGVNTSYRILSNTSVQVRIPESTQTNAPFTLNNAYTNIPISTSFTIPPPFFITRYNPSVVLTNTPLQIEGDNFYDISYVRFATTNIRPTSFNLSNIFVTAPSTAGNVSVTVFDIYTNSSRIATNLSVVRLQVQSIPSTAVPGAPIQISGQNFYNLSSVNFGGTVVLNPNYTTTLINVSVPRVTGNISVGVHDSYGNNASISFQVAPLFSVARYNPSTVIPNTSLQIIGANFSNISYVLFGTTKVLATGINTSVNVRVPSGVANNVSVTVFDLYGNSSSISANLSILNLSIRLADPLTAGPLDSVTLYGENLSNTSYVVIWNTSIPYTERSNASVRIVLPISNGFTETSRYTLTLYDIYGNNLSTPFTYIPFKITTLNPSAIQRTTIVLTGLNLSNTSTVYFGDVPATFFPSSTNLSIMVPDQSIANCSLTVSDVDGNVATLNFTYNKTILTSVIPPSGPARRMVRLSGNYLVDLSYVQFGNSSQMPILSTGNGSFNVSVPVGSGIQTITLYDIYDNTTTFTGYTYENMSLTRVNPSQGPPQRIVNLEGVYFQNLSAVYFGDIPVPILSSGNGSLNVSVPLNGSLTEARTVTVYDIYGNTTSGIYEYQYPSLISVSSAPQNASIELVGNYLSNTSFVRFGQEKIVPALVNGSWYFRVPVGSAPTTLTITDLYGNETNALPYLYRNPSIESLNPSAATRNWALTVIGSNLENIDQVRVAGQPVPFSPNPPTLILPPGEGNVSVEIKDVYGNLIQQEFYYKNPSITRLNLSSGKTNQKLKVIGQHLENTSYVLIGGTPHNGVLETNASGIAVFLPEKYGNVSVVVVDICGNETSFAGSLLCTGGDVSLSRVSPAFGPHNSSVVISGTNLSYTTEVLFGGLNASILSITESRLEVMMKYPILEPRPINVTVLDVYSDSETLISVFRPENPIVFGGSDTAGTRGLNLKLNGRFLTGTKKVWVDNTSASFYLSSQVYTSPLFVVMPEHVDGLVTIVVLDKYDNVATYPFTYQNPVLYEQNLSGPQRSPAQIVGNYLGNTSVVTFNGSSVLFEKSTSVINLSVPDGTGNASVVVEDLYGNKLYTRFEYKNPNASYLSIDHGPKNMPITIFGSYLQNTVSVRFGASTLFPVATENSITLTTPYSFGSQVIVTDRYNNTTQLTFDYENPFLYGILNAFNEPDNFGTKNKTIYIYGQYLVNTSRVLFGDLSSSFHYDPDYESLEVTVPPSEGNVSVRIIDRHLNEVQTPFEYQNSSVHSFTPTGTTGWPLTLYGEYLQACTVLFNGEDWSPIKTLNTATAIVRPGSGNVSFQITDAYNNWIPFSGVFEYRNPLLTALSASTGRAGRTLTLSGENLSNTSRVSIGSIVYPMSALDTTVEIQVPDYHGLVTVIAYDRYDASCEIGPFYAMGQEPTLVSVNPSKGPNHSPITLLGTNLSYTSRVYLGQNLSFQKTSSTITFNASIQMDPINDSLDPIQLEVYDEAGEKLTLPFTYINPKLEEVFPSEGPSQSPVTLRGKYLNRTAIVYVQNTSTPFVPGDSVTLTMPILNASNVSIVLVDDLGNRTSGNFLYKNPALFTPSPEPQRKTIRLYGENLSNTSTVTFGGQSVLFLATADYLEVKVADGNVSTTLVATDRFTNSVETILYYQNPSATTIVPGEGTFRQPVTLSGINLSNTSTVRFGNLNVSFSYVAGNSNELQVLVPDSSGNVSVVVTDIYTNEIEYPFVYKNPLLYNPPGEPQRKTIRLYGQNLSYTSTVTFDGKNVSFVPTADYIQLVVPDGNISTHIVVTDQWTNPVSVNLSYQNPSATSIEPREGPYGMPLILSGKYLNNTSTVRFGPFDASFTLVEDDLQVTVPVSSTVLGEVVVEVTDVYTNLTTIPFIYQNMVLDSLNPSSGPQRRYVEILGTNLNNTSSLFFGQYNVSFDRIEGGLRVKVPDQEGEVSVQAIDVYGNKVSAKYLYRNPRLSVITPSAGRTNRYTKFYGENLGETESVFFGDREGVLETATLMDGSLNVVIPENYGNVSVYVKDPYGNVTYWDRSFLCLGGNASVYGINPNCGTTRTRINLSGENLSFSKTVTIGANASFTIESSQNIRARAPPGTGPKHVIVTDILGEDVVYMGTFLYQNPKVTSIDPVKGTTNTLVNISGEYLQNTSTLLFGGMYVPMTNLSFRVPMGSGTATVELLDYLDNLASLDGVFTYQNQNISSLDPSEGPQYSSLRIHGQYLWNTSDVRFGLTNASILDNTTDWIDVKIPEGSSRAIVYVRDKLENIFPFDGFTYRNPYFGSIYPTEGPLNKSIQLYGLNLANTSRVIFGGIDVSYVIHSEVHLQVHAPNTSGLATIEIIDRYQNRVTYSSYLYQNPSITQILPEGPKRSTVTVLGLNLSNTSFVKFGEVNASFVRTSEGLLLTVPDASNASVTLSITDTIGNVVSTHFQYLNPELSYVDLVEGPQRSIVTVYGINLSNTSTIRFNGANTSNVNASFTPFDQGLYITVPDADARETTVTITDPFTNTVEFGFKYLNPRVYALNPSYGPHYAIIDVSGENLTNCSAFVYLSGEWVEAEFNQMLTMPPGEGITTVMFRDPLDNETSTAFTYRNASITSINPVAGPKNAPMVIRGNWLQNTFFVYFDEYFTLFERVEEEIRLTIPDSRGPIYVYDNFRNITTVDFRYENPELFAFSPDRGVQNSSTRIQGRYLTNTSFVYVTNENIREEVPFVVEGDEIEIRVPVGEGSFFVTVEDRYQNSVDLSTYFYENPRIDDLVPRAGPKNSSFRVVGVNLSSIVRVQVGRLDASFVLDLNDLEVRLPELSDNQLVELTDLYGNRLPFQVFTYENPTLLTTEAAGPQGSSLALSGLFLAQTQEILFDGNNVSFTYDGVLNLSVPRGEGNVSVLVLDPYQNVQSIDFQYQNPRFQELEPSFGPRRTIRFTGEYLNLTTMMKVGDISVDFDENLEFLLPQLEDQNVSIYAQDPYGNVVEGVYTYQNPDITYIRPGFGTKNQELQIVGKNLSNTFLVFLNDSAEILEVTGTLVRVKVPPGSGEPSLTLIDSFNNTTLFDGTFLYENPFILPPDPAPRNASIQILGQFLQNTSRVQFNGTDASFVAFLDKLDVRVPDSNASTIEVTDAYGNVLTTSFSYENPTLQSVFPYNAAQKSRIYVYGDFLAKTRRILFGTVDASFTFVSDLLEVIVPDSSGVQVITISDPYDNTLSHPFTYENPEITFLPNAPSNASIRIEGRFLGDTVEVKFGNVSADYVKSDEWIEARVPKEPNQSVLVTVRDDLGNEVYAPFTYRNPELTAQSPFAGPKNSTLTLYGINLSTTTVRFDDYIGTILVQTDEQVEVLVPDLFGDKRVILADPYGNETEGTYFFENAMLSLLDPESGPSGKPLNLYGEYLANTSAIQFNGRNVSFEKVSAQWIIPTVPTGTESVTVEWFDFFGNSILYPTLFTYQNPIVYGLSETQCAQRKIIQLLGEYIFETVRIQFGEADAEILLIESSTTIQIKVPDQIGDPIVPVVLTDRYGNTARYESFTYLNPETTHLFPEQGPSRIVVTIYGTNLSYTDTVTFGPSPATLLEKTDTSLQVLVPDSHPGQYMAVVEITDLFTNVQRLLYEYNQLQIGSVVPDHGPQYSELTMSGLFLENTSYVYFGDVSASFYYDSTLTVQIPQGTGNVSLVIEDVLGNRSVESFRYENPFLRALSPASGPQKSTVRVSGDFLSNTSQVYLGNESVNLSASFVFDSSDVIVTLPDSSGILSLTLVDRYGNAVDLPFEYTNPLITRIHPLAGRTNRYLTIYGEHLEKTETVFLTKNLSIVEKNKSFVTVVIPEAYGNVSVTTTDLYGNTQVTFFEALGGSVYTAFLLQGTTSTQITIQGDLTGFDQFRVNQVSYPLDQRIPPGQGTVPLELYDSIRDDLLFLGNFEYQNPTIHSMIPNRGTTNTRVNLSGQYLANTSYVYFGDLSAAFVYTGILEALVPANTGNVSVFVLDYLGNRLEAGNFLYENPDIQAISPPEGPPRTSLRVQGKFLNNTSSAKIGVPCEIESISEQDVYLKVPPGTGTVSVELRDKLGNLILFDAQEDGGYTYLNPRIEKLVPAEGPRNIPIRLEGENLGRTTRVFIGENVSFVYINGALQIRAPQKEGVLEVFAEDDLLNVTAPLSFTFLNPSIRDIDVSEGPTGIPIVLDGSNLANTSTIRFGEANASFEYRNGWLYTKAPPGTSNVSIEVIDAYDNTVAVPFRYKNPYISRVAIQGPTMIVQGDYLNNTSRVFIDEQPVQFRLTPTGLVADLLNASGSIAIELIDRYENHTFYEGEFYYFIPSITNIYPHSGLTGSPLTIYGENFSNTTFVTVGSINASIQSIEPEKIEVMVPPGSGIVVVEVFEKNENSTKYNGRFTYETITLYKVEPIEAYANQIVFIEGSDLSKIESVEFGEYTVTDITYISPTVISVKVPPVEEPSLITVKDAFANKGSYPFFKRIIPTVTSLSDSRAAGDLLRFTGTHLDQVQVLFDRTQAVLHSVSASTIVCTIPYGKGTVPITLKDGYQNTYLV